MESRKNESLAPRSEPRLQRWCPSEGASREPTSPAIGQPSQDPCAHTVTFGRNVQRGHVSFRQVPTLLRGPQLAHIHSGQLGVPRLPDPHLNRVVGLRRIRQLDAELAQRHLHQRGRNLHQREPPQRHPRRSCASSSGGHSLFRYSVASALNRCYWDSSCFLSEGSSVGLHSR